MLSTRSIVKQRCGMLKYCGLDVLDFSSILAEASRRFSLLAPMKWYTVGKEPHRPTGIVLLWCLTSSPDSEVKGSEQCVTKLVC